MLLGISPELIVSFFFFGGGGGGVNDVHQRVSNEDSYPHKHDKQMLQYRLGTSGAEAALGELHGRPQLREWPVAAGARRAGDCHHGAGEWH